MNLLRSIIERETRVIVSEYLDTAPVASVNRIVCALDLTDKVIRRMIDEAKGDRIIEIVFKSGDTAIIRNSNPVTRGGPGW